MLIGPMLLTVLAGALWCNAIPHLAAGLRGEPFPTPFATPRGVGLSPPLINVWWGAGNLFAGLALTLHDAALLDHKLALALLLLGFVAIGSYLALHFGRVRAAR